MEVVDINEIEKRFGKIRKKGVSTEETREAYRKWKDGEISKTEYNDVLAKARGYKDRNEYRNERNHESGRHRPVDEIYVSERTKELAKKLKSGEIDRNEYNRELNYEAGRILGSMKDRKESPQYLGIYITEGILEKIFPDAKRMPNNNEGYDFYCEKYDLKIDAKSASLRKRGGGEGWLFNIRYNKIANRILLMGYGAGRDELMPSHVWMLEGDDIVRGRKVSECSVIWISNSVRGLKEFEKFERKEWLEDAVNVCKVHNKKNK